MAKTTFTDGEQALIREIAREVGQGIADEIWRRFRIAMWGVGVGMTIAGGGVGWTLAKAAL